MSVQPVVQAGSPAQRPERRPRTSRRRWWVGWTVMAVLGVGVAAFSLPYYVDGDPETTRIPSNPAFTSHQLWVAMHAVPGVLALAIGPFQFLSRFRREHPAWHRWLGRVYLVSVLVGAVVAVPTALISTSGIAAQAGFLLLSAAWTYTAVMAYRTARARQFQLHRVWMIRSYSLTFAAVMLRVFLGIGVLAMQVWPHLSFHEIYTASAWSGLLVSYVVAEWFVVQRITGPLLRGRAPRTPRQVTRDLPDGAVVAAAGGAR